MKQSFFYQMFTSGKTGRVSSKRVVMVFFVLLYAYCLLYNIYTGKAPTQLFQEQLFELVLISLLAVFGEQVTSLLSLMRGEKNEPEKPKI